MAGWMLTRTTHVMMFVLTSTLAVNSHSQNSIHPRNSSTKITQEGQTCLLDSDTNSWNKSPCKIPCEKDDDCINYGRHICCPTLRGSSCLGECLVADPKTETTTEFCIDVRSRKRYSPGERFISGNKCCACEEGRIDCASSVNTCHLSCKRNSEYYKHGESIPSKSCHNCSCHNGSVICSSDVNCLQGKCKYKGKWYKGGDVLRLHGGCKECVCRSGRWNCIAVTCSAVRSKGNALSCDHGAYLQTALVSLLTYTLQVLFCC